MTKNIFGTDGIRARVGESPLTRESAVRLGIALGKWIVTTYGNNQQILMAHDTRISAYFLKAALKTGLLSFAISIYDAEVLPTPVVSHLVEKENRFVCGLIISASHNPFYDNGVKIVTRTGKVSLPDEHTISDFFYDKQNTEPNYEQLGIEKRFQHAGRIYHENLYHYFDKNFLTGIRIVLDCAHGATYKVAPRIFKSFGAQVHVINNKPTGMNINALCGSTDVKGLQKAVLLHQADIGFAFDGDGDRLIAVTHNGLIINGDALLALLMQYPLYSKEMGIVGTMVSNYELELFANRMSKKFFRADVGDKHVLQCMKANNLLLGGEESGHIIMRDYLSTGDGIFSALRVAYTVQLLGDWSFSFFQPLPQVTFNIPVNKKKELHHHPIATIIETQKNQLPHGRLVVRYSGTEPLLRIMIENTDITHAQEIGETLRVALQKELS